MCTDEQRRLTASWLNIIGAGTISAGGVTQAVAVLIGDRVGAAALNGAGIAGACLLAGFSVHLLARQVLAGVSDQDASAGSPTRGQGAALSEDIGLSAPGPRSPLFKRHVRPETLMEEFRRRSREAANLTPSKETGSGRQGAVEPADSDATANGLDSTPEPFFVRSANEGKPMPATEPPDPASPPFPSEEDVDAILYEFRGDAREAIRALLHDLAVLAEDFDASVSYGFVRGGVPKLLLRRRAG